MASCDGEVSSNESVFLSMGAAMVIVGDDAEKKARVEARKERLTDLESSVKALGFDATAERVLEDALRLLGELPAEDRADAVRSAVNGAVLMIKADREVSEAERSFIVDKLAPALGMTPAEAAAVAERGATELARTRRYDDYGFEAYVMVYSADPEAPVVLAAGQEQFGGVIGATAALAKRHRLSPAGVGAYLRIHGWPQRDQQL